MDGVGWDEGKAFRCQSLTAHRHSTITTRPRHKILWLKRSRQDQFSDHTEPGNCLLELKSSGGCRGTRKP